MKRWMHSFSSATFALGCFVALASCGSEQGLDGLASGDGAEQGLREASLFDTLQLGASSSSGSISLNAASSYCVDIHSNSGTNGAAVLLYKCNGSAAQTFTFTNGMLQASNNRCLNVKDGKNKDGALIQMWACSSSDINSQFTISNGQIKWKGNGKCLDLRDGAKKDGQPLQLWECFDGSENQQWTYKASSTPSGSNSGSSSGSTNTGSGSDKSFANSPVKDLKVIPWNKFSHIKMARGQVNNEQEQYIDDGSTISVNSENQLVVTAYVAKDNNGASGKNTKWMSGRLNTPNLGISKGYIEARMKTPSAAGTWPAFWLMPNDNRPTWPQGGEIDIMEQVDGLNQQNMSTHWGPSPSQTHNTHKATTLANFSNNWHTFGVAFDGSHCAFYIDGKKVQTVQYAAGSPFAAQIPKYGAIVNLAMGGNWPKAAEASIGTQKLITDYVAISSSVPSDF